MKASVIRPEVTIEKEVKEFTLRLKDVTAVVLVIEEGEPIQTTVDLRPIINVMTETQKKIVIGFIKKIGSLAMNAVEADVIGDVWGVIEVKEK